MLGGKLVVVDAEHHRQIDFLARCRNQHPLGPGIEMLLPAGAVGEEAGAFERNVDAVGGVGQIGRIALGGDMDSAAIDDQIIAINFDRAAERTVDRIALEQPGIGLGIRQIVDRNQFEPAVRTLDDRARDIAPDAPETVDCNLDRHGKYSC